MLGQLTEVGNVTKEQFARRFNEFRQQGDTYFVVVCEDLAKRQVAGCATLMVEKKIIHDCGSVRRRSTLPYSPRAPRERLITQAVPTPLLFPCLQCGHIEDVVVDSTYRGKNLGLKYAMLHSQRS